MDNIVISFGDVIDLNHILHEKGNLFKVHLHDACGSQSFTIDVLNEDSGMNDYDSMKNEIIRFFQEKNISVKFSDNSASFLLYQSK